MKTQTVVRTLYRVVAGVTLSLFAYVPSQAFMGFGSFQSPQQFLVIHPTTTVTIETSNNTSGADNYVNPGNGNETVTNISKVDIHSLLYTGNDTKVFVHLEPWFCYPGSGGYCNGHILTGYNSNDSNQVHKQITDMISRGVQGTIIDWYGQYKAIENGTSLKVRDEAQRDGFQFIIMDDGGQYVTACGNNAGCIESAMISDLNYAANNFINSGAYGKAPNGDPYMFFFHPFDGSNNEASINWSRVYNAVAQYHYRFIFENQGGFGHSESVGAYSWVHASQTGWQSYLNSFYSTAKQDSPPKYTFGSGFKGFDDHLCTWTQHRLLSQWDGQVYLGTFGIADQQYSRGTQLPNLQVVTWNDYDEGTEVETGVDNGVSITASVDQNGLLSWDVAHDTNPIHTVDHFTVFVSADDYNLMVLQDNIPITQTTLSLTPYNLPPNTFLRVKAVGKPMIANHLTAGGVQYGGGGGGTGGIQGQVLSAIDQHPISGATVNSVLGQLMTSSTGYYIYNNVRPGHYVLTASAGGWLPNSSTVTVTNTMVTQNILISTAGKIAGWVKNSQGIGLVGANVNCSGGVLPINQNYTTDSNGNYGSSWIPVTNGGGTNYTCTTTALGYQQADQQGIQVMAGHTTAVNFSVTADINPNPTTH